MGLLMSGESNSNSIVDSQFEHENGIGLVIMGGEMVSCNRNTFEGTLGPGIVIVGVSGLLLEGNYFVSATQPHCATHTNIFIYLNTGLPILSTIDIDFPKEMVRICPNKGEFVNTIYETLSEENSSLSQQRILYASENTWQSKLHKLISMWN